MLAPTVSRLTRLRDLLAALRDEQPVGTLDMDTVTTRDALRGLTDKGLTERAGRGYRLTERGHAALAATESLLEYVA